MSPLYERWASRFVVLYLTITTWGNSASSSSCNGWSTNNLPFHRSTTTTTTTTKATMLPSRSKTLPIPLHGGSIMKRQHNRFRMSSSPAASSSSSSPNDGNSITTTTTTTQNLSILAVLLSTSLNLLGFTLTSPLTPTLGTHFSLSLGASFGSLTSAYPLGMLLGLFLWPRLSDRAGRKPVLVGTLAGSAVGLSLQALSVWRRWSLEGFLMTRAFTGCFAGSSPVAKAFLADLVGKVDRANAQTQSLNRKRNPQEEEEEEGDGGGQQRQTNLLSKYLAWRDASSTLAYIIGPALGGILFETSRRMFGGVEKGTTAALSFVIGLSALASFLAAALVGLWVDGEGGRGEGEGEGNSSNPNKAKKSTSTNTSTTVEEDNNNSYIIACPLGNSLYTGVATVCVVSFLYHVADSTFFAFFPALLSRRLGLDAQGVGLAFTAFACVSFSMSALGVSTGCIRTLGVVNTCALGLSVVGGGLAVLGRVAGGGAGAGAGVTAGAAVVEAVQGGFFGLGPMGLLLLGAAGMYFCGVPLYGPTIPTMLLQCVPPYQRGTVMGIDGAVNTIARVIAPIIMGDIYRRKGPGATFGLASGAVFCSAFIALFRRFLVLRDHRRLQSSKE